MPQTPYFNFAVNQNVPDAMPVFLLNENIEFFDEQMWASATYSASWQQGFEDMVQRDLLAETGVEGEGEIDEIDCEL